MHLLINGYCTVVLDSRQRCRSVKMLRNEGVVALPVKLLRMCYAYLVVGRYSMSAQVIKQREIANRSKAIVQSKTTFKNTIQTPLSYMQVFEEDFGLYFVNLRKLDIVEDMTSSNFLASTSTVAYIRKITVSKKMNEHQGVLNHLVKLSKDASVAKSLGMTNFYDTRHYTSSEEDVFLMSKADGEFVKNESKPFPFLANYLYRHFRTLLNNLHASHLYHDKQKFPTFAMFIHTKIRRAIISSHSTRSLFVSTRRPFD